MKTEVQNIISRMNLDNIWSNSYDDVVALQRALKVKDDGIIGKNTIKALQRELQIEDDGKWGKESINTAKTRIKTQPQTTSKRKTQNTSINYSDSKSQDKSQDKFPVFEGTSDFLWNITKAKTGINTPSDYMSKTKSGKATPEEIAQERLSTVSDYITDDIGGNVSYKIGTHVPEHKRTSATTSTSDLKTQFDKEYSKSTGDTQTDTSYDIYPTGWSVTGDVLKATKPQSYDWWNWETISIPTFTSPSNYEIELNRRIQNVPAETKVSSVTKSAGNNTQKQLDDTDRKQWTQELNTEVLQMAELYSQLENAKTEIQNGFTPEQRQAAQERYNQLAHRIAMTSNAKTFKLNGEKIDAFPSDYREAINKGLKEWSPENQAVLQQLYEAYGVSPYWNHMPWGERYTLDHLYGAGYGYNGPSSGKQTVGQIGQKLSDAINGKFTPRTYNGVNNGSFVLSGDRQGVHRHLAQRGENLTNWQYNVAPKDVSGKSMDQPYFKIGDQWAWDWSTGTPQIPLSTTNNYKYGIHQRNSTVMADPKIAKNPYVNRDFSTFDKWSPKEQREAAEWLHRSGFNVGDTSKKGYLQMISTGEQNYDFDTVKKVYIDIQNAIKSFKNPSQKQLSGENSFYHFPMQQTNNYTSNIFGNSISGVQMMNGKPYTFNQDNYDISIPGFSMFGNEAWYRNMNEIPTETWNRMTGK